VSERLLLRRFSDHITRDNWSPKGRIYDCRDGSRFVLSKSDSPGFVFVELQAYLDEGFRMVEEFVAWCRVEQIGLRSVRNGRLLPASMGAVFSDMKRSKAFRSAAHKWANPRDWRKGA
jgi:hypothetical protein